MRDVDSNFDGKASKVEIFNVLKKMLGQNQSSGSYAIASTVNKESATK